MNPKSPELEKEKIIRDQAHKLADAAREESKLQGYEQMKENAMQIAIRQLLQDKIFTSPKSDQS